MTPKPPPSVSVTRPAPDDDSTMLLDTVTLDEIEALQTLLSVDLAGAMAAMYSVADARCYRWRAWMSARRNGHADVTLADVGALPLLPLLEATAQLADDGGVTDAGP